MDKINLRCEHIGLAAAQPQKLADWYEKVFMLQKVLKGTVDRGPYFLICPNSNFIVEIFFQEELTDSDSVHFCFHVDDIEQAILYLPKDVKEISPIKQQEDGSKVYFFKDPVGHILQFSQRSNSRNQGGAKSRV